MIRSGGGGGARSGGGGGGGGGGGAGGRSLGVFTTVPAALAAGNKRLDFPTLTCVKPKKFIPLVSMTYNLFHASHLFFLFIRQRVLPDYGLSQDFSLGDNLSPTLVQKTAEQFFLLSSLFFARSRVYGGRLSGGNAFVLKHNRLDGLHPIFYRHHTAFYAAHSRTYIFEHCLSLRAFFALLMNEFLKLFTSIAHFLKDNSNKLFQVFNSSV